MATAAPLMPKATAVWLVDNTALSFDQIAEFCKLHPLEVKAIADGDAAQGIKGLDPILTGQLTREQIAEAEKNPAIRLKLTEPKVAVPPTERGKKGPRYTPVSRRQDRPNAILWLVRNHPELKDSADHAAGRHHQVDHCVDSRAHALELAQSDADGSGHARPVPRRSTSIWRSRAPTRKSRRPSIPAQLCFPPPRPPRARRPKSPQQPRKPSRNSRAAAKWT